MGNQTPNSKNDRQYNVQKKKTKRQPMVDKTVNRKPGREDSFCSTSSTRRVTLVCKKNQVISKEGK